MKTLVYCFSGLGMAFLAGAGFSGAVLGMVVGVIFAKSPQTISWWALGGATTGILATILYALYIANKRVP